MLKPVTIAALSLATLVALAFSQVQAAPNENSTETTAAQKSRGAGPDPNIKSSSAKNDPKSEATSKAPPEKGGPNTRGTVCHFHVDNRTRWKIQIFVDGEYVGLVSPWGDSHGNYGGANHVVYGLAEFTDGSDKYWGPESITCIGKFTWTLTSN